MAVLALFVPVACGDDDADGADVTATCDRLEDLAYAVRGAGEATNRAEVEEVVGDHLDSFVDSAKTSGDGQLAEMAKGAKEAFSGYIHADDGLDGREAGNEFDILLDRSARRCLERGATNHFPTEE